MEVLDKQIQVKKNYANGEINNKSDNRIKTWFFRYSHYAIVMILIEE
jgi:hypothetical protein